jgi:hypothetical protein
MHGSNHTRYSKAMPDMKQIPVPERDKPSLQAIVTSPGWREMSLSARAVAMTLLALARTSSAGPRLPI